MKTECIQVAEIYLFRGDHEFSSLESDAVRITDDNGEVVIVVGVRDGWKEVDVPTPFTLEEFEKKYNYVLLKDLPRTAVSTLDDFQTFAGQAVHFHDGVRGHCGVLGAGRENVEGAGMGFSLYLMLGEDGPGEVMHLRPGVESSIRLLTKAELNIAHGFAYGRMSLEADSQ